MVNAADARNIYEMPAGAARRGPRRRGVRHPAARPASSTSSPWEALVDRIEAADAAGAHRPHRQVRRPARRLPVGGREPASTPASTTAPRSRSTGSRPRTSRGCSPTGRLRDLDGIVIPGGFGERGIEGKIAAAGYAREHGIPCLGLCLGLQVMTIEFARNVLGLAGANSTEFDPPRPHPVIDLMDDQRDVVDMGGTMRLGAYYAVLQPGLAGRTTPTASRSCRERHRHRYEFNTALPPPLRGRPASCCSGHVARRAARRVHRARRPPVLGRHAGPPRVQEPARPAAPAVPRARRRGAAARAEGRNPHLIAVRRSPSVGRAASADGVSGLPPARRAAWSTGAIWQRRRRRRSRAPTASAFERDIVRSPGRGGGGAAALRRRGRRRRGARAPVPRRRSTPTLLEIPAGMRDVAGEPPEDDRAARAGRGGRPGAPASSSCSTEFHNSAGHDRREHATCSSATDLTAVPREAARARGGAHDASQPCRWPTPSAEVAAGEISDAKTIIGLLLAERLRSAGRRRA